MVLLYELGADAAEGCAVPGLRFMPAPSANPRFIHIGPIFRPPVVFNPRHGWASTCNP